MFKKQVFAALMVAIPVATFAQDLTSSTPAEATPAPAPFESTPAPEPVFAPAPAAASTQAASPAAFDKLRGRSYGGSAFGNQAAAFTVADYLDWPHLMAGNKFLYVEPAGEYGTVSADMGGKTIFLNLDNTDQRGIMTIGMAMSQSMGVELRLSKDRTMTTVNPDAGDETTTSVVGEGDQMGVGFSMNMGTNALRVSADWITPTAQTNSETGSAKNEQDFSEYILEAGFSNFPSGADLVWTAGFTFDRLSETSKAGAGDEVIGANANTNIILNFDAGMKILSNGTSRVLLGSNNSIGYQMWDNLDGTREDSTRMVLALAPNIVGEYAFNENWMISGGASHTFVPFGMSGATSPTVNERSSMFIQSGATMANAGVRYQKDNFAVEAGIQDGVFNDGPASFFSGTNRLYNFGAFLYF